MHIISVGKIIPVVRSAALLARQSGTDNQLANGVQIPQFQQRALDSGRKLSTNTLQLGLSIAQPNGIAKQARLLPHHLLQSPQ